jgi:hypothetical protein
MSRQLSPSHSLEQLKKQAKSLLKGQQAADSEALTRIRENHPRWRNLSEEQVAASPFALWSGYALSFRRREASSPHHS